MSVKVLFDMNMPYCRSINVFDIHVKHDLDRHHRQLICQHPSVVFFYFSKFASMKEVSIYEMIHMIEVTVHMPNELIAISSNIICE